nr:radical SAM protein [Candidatus Bathyarchaeota archaeon]
RDLGVIEIVFSGGNPLIREDIGEILDYASKNFVTTVYDNGSMAAKKIDALKNVDFVAISLDTLDEKKNDYLKGVPGSWKRAMESIRLLKEEGIPVVVSPTISQFNVHEIVDFTRYFIKRSIPVWYCFYWYDYPFEDGMFKIGKKNDEYMIRDKKALLEALDSILKLREESNYVYITERTLKALREFVASGVRKWRCRALDSFLIVDHLGRVAGCHSREPVASIFELPEVWRSPKFEMLRRKYSQCTKCAYLCYIFYSVHAGLSGTLEILRDQWKNAKILLQERARKRNNIKRPRLRRNITKKKIPLKSKMQQNI